MWLKRIDRGLILSIILFLVFLPLVLQINFSQNDDWVYYRMVRNFMGGRFNLDPISAPTFYFQGALGAIFASIFGLTKLPVLTLAISVANFYLFYKIILHLSKIGPLLAVVLSLIWFFNPLNIYSSLGFMTENYLLFCILISLYFFGLFIHDAKVRHLFFCNLFLIFGLLTKQSALALSVAYPAYFLVNRKWRLFFLQLLVAVTLFTLYFLLFPKTAEMYEKPLQFHHIADIDYLKQLTRAILIYISAFCFPMLAFLVSFVKPINKRNNFVVALLFIVISIILSFILFRNYKPNRLGWQEFYYLDNTLERAGFYPRGVMGTKYHFRGNYDLYKYWDLAAKSFSGFVVFGMLISLKKLKSHAHLIAFFAVYFGLMLVAEKVYDRYLPPLFLAFILIISSLSNQLNFSKKVLLVSVFLPFLAFLIFYSYQLSMDFVLVNKYIWNRSLELVDKEKISPKYIKGTNSWKLSDYNYERNYLYDFTFDDVLVNKRYGEQYDLVEKHKVDFLGSIWVDPYVYLYKKRNFVDVVE